MHTFLSYSFPCFFSKGVVDRLIRRAVVVWWFIKGLSSSVLTPKRWAKGKFHYPTAGLFSASLKMKIKISFSFRNCKKLCKKAQNAIISLSFPFYVNWQPPENRRCIGERARREVA